MYIFQGIFNSFCKICIFQKLKLSCSDSSVWKIFTSHSIHIIILITIWTYMYVYLCTFIGRWRMCLHSFLAVVLFNDYNCILHANSVYFIWLCTLKKLLSFIVTLFWIYIGPILDCRRRKKTKLLTASHNWRHGHWSVTYFLLQD